MNIEDLKIHKCGAPAVLDLTGLLTKKDFRQLKKGVNIVTLDNRQKTKIVEETAAALNASYQKCQNKVTIEIPEQVEKRITTGAIIGLPLQKGDPFFYQQGKTIHLPNDRQRNIHLEIANAEQNDMRRLAEKHEGIFKKCDKGGTLVFMKKDYYRKICDKHLLTANYIETTREEIKGGQKELKDLLQCIEKENPKLFQKIFKNVDLEEDRVRYIYFLIKIHKPIEADGLYRGRPIVDCKRTPFAAADKLSAEFCKPLIYVMHTIALSNLVVLSDIRKLQTSGKNVVFWVADVYDLYTNVPINEAIDSVGRLLEKYQVGDAQARPYIRRILEIVLKYNIFSCGERTFKQLHGVPMGSNIAPLAADAFLFEREEEFIKSNKGILMFRRYRDDMLAITQTEEAAAELENSYNNMHPRIKIESERSVVAVNFLDIRLSKFSDGALRTGVYFKPTDTLQMLHKSSAHPANTIKGIIQGRILSFLRICNNLEDFMTATLSLAEQGPSRGYTPEEILDEVANVARKCVWRPWPFKAHKENDDQLDKRTAIKCTYVPELEPVYDVMRRRKVKFCLTEAPPLLRKLCRSKDW